MVAMTTSPDSFGALSESSYGGDVDHVVIYVGPGGRCVEAGAKGKVITFDIIDNAWNA